MSDERTVPRWLATAAGVSWRLIVVAGAIGLTVWALSRVMLVVLPLLVALMLCTVFVPLAVQLERLRVPRALAALLAVVGGAAVIAGLLGVVIPQLVSQLGALGESVQEGFQTVLDLAGRYLGMGEQDVQQLVDRGIQQVQEQAGAIGGGLLAGAVAVGEFITGTVLMLVMAFFIVKDRERITGWFLARTPAHRREELAAVSRRAWHTLGGYFRGQAIIALVDAIGIGIGLLVIGVPLVLPLAALTLIGGFFPIVGAVLAGLVAVLVALVDGGLTDALLVLAVVVAVQQTESNILEPVVLGRAVPLHPLVILVVITAGAVLAGVVGAFLSVPIAAVLAAAGNEIRLRGEATA